MKIAIVDDRHVCEDCGSAPILYSPARNEHLEADLSSHFKEEVPWYRPVKRRRHQYVASEIERVVNDLRQQTATITE